MNTCEVYVPETLLGVGGSVPFPIQSRVIKPADEPTPSSWADGGRRGLGRGLQAPTVLTTAPRRLQDRPGAMAEAILQTIARCVSPHMRGQA